MLKDSAVFKVLSPEVPPAFDLGQKLSILNNDFHPQLNVANAARLDEVQFLLRSSLENLQAARAHLKNLPIELSHFSLALNYLHSYIYIIDVTLDLPKNRLVANYAQAKKGGAKWG